MRTVHWPQLSSAADEQTSNQTDVKKRRRSGFFDRKQLTKGAGRVICGVLTACHWSVDTAADRRDVLLDSCQVPCECVSLCSYSSRGGGKYRAKKLLYRLFTFESADGV